jgi:hypothetical protein
VKSTTYGAGARDVARGFAVSADGTRVALGGEQSTLTATIEGFATLYDVSGAGFTQLASLTFGSAFQGTSRVNAASFDASNNAYYSGARYTLVNVQTQALNTNATILKLNALGQFQWGTDVNGGSYTESLHHVVASDGTVYLAGLFDPAPNGTAPNTISTGSSLSSFLIARVPADGGVVGLQSFRIADFLSDQRDRAHAIGISGSGELYVAGISNEEASAAGPGRQIVAVAKTTPNPTNFSLSSAVNIIQSDAPVPTRISASQQTNASKLSTMDISGNVYVASRVRGFSSDDILVTKLNSAGVVQWQRRIDRAVPSGGGAFGNDIPHGIALSFSTPPDVYVVGETEGIGTGQVFPYRAIAVKLNGADGTVAWSRVMSSSVAGTSAAAYAVDFQGIYSDIVIAGVDGSARDANGVTASSNGAWLMARIKGSDGTIKWTRTFEDSGATTSPLEDRATQLIIKDRDLSNIFLLVGGTVNRGTDNASGADYDLRFLRFDEIGGFSTPTLSANPQWNVSTSGVGNDSLADMRWDSYTSPPNSIFERIYFTGARSNASGGSSMLLGGIGLTGGIHPANPVLVTSVLTGDVVSPNAVNAGYGLAQDFATKHVYVVGALTNTVGGESFSVLKFNETLQTELWRKNFNGAVGDSSDRAHAATFKSDGPIVSGTLFEGTAQMATMQLRKSDGEPFWVVTSDSPGSDSGTAIASSVNGAFNGRAYAIGLSGDVNDPQTLTIQAIDRANCTLNVDGRAGASATADGLIILRRILGINETAASNGTTPLNNIDDRDNLVSTLALRGDYDVDASGTTDFKDALVIVRYLLGFTGSNVTDGLALTGTRNLWEPALPTTPTVNNSIRVYLQSCGTL